MEYKDLLNYCMGKKINYLEALCMPARNCERKEQLSKCKKVIFSGVSICQSAHMKLFRLVHLGALALATYLHGDPQYVQICK